MKTMTFNESVINRIPSLKNDFASIILEYKTIPFNDKCSDAACIARIVEIFTLGKLRVQGARLTSLTGLIIPDTEADTEEINLLLMRCEKLCRTEENQFAVRNDAVTVTKAAMNSISGVSKSISEVRDRKFRGADRAEAERHYQTALSRLNHQKERLAYFKCLPGLLMHEAEFIGKGINLPLLHSFHSSVRIPVEPKSLLENLDISRAVQFITVELDKLVSAVNSIIKLCSPPTDRYELNNGGFIRAEAYREYFSADNNLLRAIISADEYVSSVLGSKKSYEQKKKFFSI
ncbi:hypothetical protein [Atlantibacter subterraneus]|uniref:hypothetical protein n=1 Tax=Atlantibacter subterraneus TaxID=255519 RepID=UPI0021ADCEA1|nr:hypothetical protein [Atlantibacter subterranea]